MLLRSKYAPKLQSKDILEVMSRYKEFTVCKLTAEASDLKYSGAEAVAVIMCKTKNH